MTESNIPVRSPQEEINILYNLKALVGEYRQKPTLPVLSEIFKYFTGAAEIAAENDAGLKEIFNNVAEAAKKEIINTVNTAAALKKWEVSKGFDELINQTAIKDINQKISIAEDFREKNAEIQKEIKALDSGDTSAAPKNSVKTASVKTAEDSEIVKQLKAEAIAAVEKNKTLTDSEKKLRIEKINTTNVLKVKVKASKCSIIYDTAIEPVETSLAINGVILEGKFSRHAKIEKASLAELAKISAAGKEFKTAAGLVQKSQADSQKRASKKSEIEAQKRQAKLTALKNQSQELESNYAEAKKAAGQAVIAMIKNIDSQKLYQVLALEPQKRKTLLAYLTKQQNVSELAESIPDKLADGIIWNKKVWKLYMNDEKKLSQSSYYDSCLERARPFHEVYKETKAFMESGDITEKKCNTTILKIAGTKLPKDAAQDLFLSAVFHYGMGLIRDDAFNPEKFDKMNEVLSSYGYKIKLNPMYVAQEPAKGAMALSQQILNEMHSNGHKAKKNKTIALLYKLAQFRKEHGNQSLRDISVNPEIRKLYTDFSLIFFDDKLPADTPLVNNKYEKSWNAFTENSLNRQKAEKVYNFLNSEARTPGELKRWVDNLEAGLYVPETDSLRVQTTHHNFDRKYAGLFDNGIEILNYSDNLTSTMCMHPADNDPHKEAHKFDMKQIYLYSRNNQFINSSFNNIKAGDTFYYPEILKEQSNGNWRPIIERDTLLVTAGEAIAEPEVPGRLRNLIQKYIEPITTKSTQPFRNKTAGNPNGSYAPLSR